MSTTVMAWRAASFRLLLVIASTIHPLRIPTAVGTAAGQINLILFYKPI